MNIKDNKRKIKLIDYCLKDFDYIVYTLYLFLLLKSKLISKLYKWFPVLNIACSFQPQVA